MPLYEFYCKDCDISFEKIMRSYSVGQKICCDACKGHNVQKAITAAGYRLASSTGKAPVGSMNRCASKPGFS